MSSGALLYGLPHRPAEELAVPALVVREHGADKSLAERLADAPDRDGEITRIERVIIDPAPPSLKVEFVEPPKRMGAEEEAARLALRSAIDAKATALDRVGEAEERLRRANELVDEASANFTRRAAEDEAAAERQAERITEWLDTSHERPVMTIPAELATTGAAKIAAEAHLSAVRRVRDKAAEAVTAAKGDAERAAGDVEKAVGDVLRIEGEAIAAELDDLEDRAAALRSILHDFDHLRAVGRGVGSQFYGGPRAAAVLRNYPRHNIVSHPKGRTRWHEHREALRTNPDAKFEPAD